MGRIHRPATTVFEKRIAHGGVDGCGLLFRSNHAGVQLLLHSCRVRRPIRWDGIVAVARRIDERCTVISTPKQSHPRGGLGQRHRRRDRREGFGDRVECKSVERVKGDVGDSTFYSQKLIAAGNPMADGIVLDTMLARSIGVTIGDTVQLAWEHHREEPAPKRTARVVCLVRPTAETSGVLFIGSVPKAPRLGVDVFVADDASGEMFDGATTMDVEFLMREQTVDSARARFEEVLSRNTRYTLIWVSLMAYGGYQLWDQIDRVQDRRKRYAVLISMGLEDTRIIRALRREQLVLSLITAPLGCVLGAWALVATTRLYLPFDSLVTVGFYAIGVNLLTAVIVGLRLRGELRRLPVAALLSEV